MALRVVSREGRIFRDREEAGLLLAEQLTEFRSRGALVLGIPRGGIVIGNAVAASLNAELDILLSRKIGAPETPELAVGAVAEDGTVFLNDAMIEELGLSRQYVEEETARQKREIQRRVRLFRPVRPKARMNGRPVIVTDDGAATGATLQAALQSCRHERPSTLVCAFPAGSDQAAARLKQNCDLLVALSVPAFFVAVSQAYAGFPQISDEQVLHILTDRRRDENRKKTDSKI